MQKSVFGWSAVVLALVAFLAVNLLADTVLRNANIDLTENGLFTISDGTESVLADLDEPVTLQYFFSEDLAGNVPSIRSYGQRVEDLLRTYAAEADGMIRLEVIDPEPFSSDEDQAVAYGVQGVPLDASGAQFYFGLVGSNTIGDREVIPFFQQDKEPFLEYDLTRLVQNLSAAVRPVVGVMTDLPVDGVPGNPQLGQRGLPEWAVMDRLSQEFDIRRIETNATLIAEDVRVLVLMHPHGMSDATLYAIDQFVMGGGRLVVFADPFSEAASLSNRAGAAMGGQPIMVSSDLTRLFEAWGIEVADGVFVGDLGQAQRVNAQTPGSTTARPVDYLAWLGVRDAQMSRDDVSIALLDQVNMGTAGYVDVTAESGLTMTPLMWTTPDSQVISITEVGGNPDPAKLLGEFVSSGNVYTLAARLNGPLGTAFPDGAPTVEETAAEGEAPAQPASHLATTVEPANMIVVADSDLLDNTFWANQQNFFGQTVVIPIADNADFLANVVDQMTGSDDLIALRSRGQSQRPFTAVEDLRRQAELQFQAEEQALTAKLEELQTQLAQLDQAAAGIDGLLTEEQIAAEESFRAELVATRAALRDVQLNLNREIDELAAWVEFINIALVPLLLVGAAGVYHLFGRRRPA